MRFLIVLTLFIFHTAAWAESIDFWGGNTQYSYSATRIMDSKNDDAVMMKEYVAPGKVRLEMFDPDTQKLINIVLLLKDENQYISLIPESKIAMNMTSLAQMRNFGINTKYEVLENKRVGSDKVNGYAATKYKVKVKDVSGDVNQGYIWKTKQGVVIKMESIDQNDKWTMELQNLKFAKQNASLFVVPDDYQSMGDAMANFGQFMKDNGMKPRSDEQFNEDMNKAGQDAVKAGVQEAIEEDASSAIKNDVKNKLKGLIKW